MLGGIIVCSGYFAAVFFSTTIFISFVSGLGMSYPKWRQLTNGLIGLVVSVPVAHWLLQQHGIHGSLLILGCLPCCDWNFDTTFVRGCEHKSGGKSNLVEES